MCELINTLNVLVSCTQLVHSIGVDKLGHIGACALPIGGCALPIGGCAQPLEMSPTHIKTTPSYHVLSLGDQYIEYVCGRRLNLGWIKWAMLRLSGKLTIFDSISLGRHQRIRARAELPRAQPRRSVYRMCLWQTAESGANQVSDVEIVWKVNRFWQHLSRSHQRIRAIATPWLQKALICQQTCICMLSTDRDELQAAPAVPGQLCYAVYTTGKLRWFPRNK